MVCNIFYFSIQLGIYNNPNWLSYFSEGLKPPTTSNSLPQMSPLGFVTVQKQLDPGSLACFNSYILLSYFTSLFHRLLYSLWIENPVLNQCLLLSAPTAETPHFVDGYCHFTAMEEGIVKGGIVKGCIVLSYRGWFGTFVGNNDPNWLIYIYIYQRGWNHQPVGICIGQHRDSKYANIGQLCQLSHAKGPLLHTPWGKQHVGSFESRVPQNLTVVHHVSHETSQHGV